MGPGEGPSPVPHLLSTLLCWGGDQRYCHPSCGVLGWALAGVRDLKVQLAHIHEVAALRGAVSSSRALPCEGSPGRGGGSGSGRALAPLSSDCPSLHPVGFLPAFGPVSDNSAFPGELALSSA